MSDELRACPFCGGESSLDKLGPSSRPWVPQCVNIFGDNPCGCSLGRYATKEDAVAAWNRRAEPTPLVWSSERPRVVGDYIVRTIGHKSRYLINIDESDLACGDIGFEGYEFAGPLPEPTEAK